MVEQSTRSLSFILHRSRNMLLMCDETYFTRMWCVFELAARLRQDGNRPVNVLCSGYGAMAVQGCVVHCIAAVLLGFQPPSYPGLTAGMPARRGSVLGRMLITALFVHKVLGNFVRPAARSALLRGSARQVQS